MLARGCCHPPDSAQLAGLALVYICALDTSDHHLCKAAVSSGLRCYRTSGH